MSNAWLLCISVHIPWADYSTGNQSMQLQLYSEAAEIYACAIALDEKNAVYYCNR